MDKLFSDLETDIEKANWFLSGRGYETGVIAQAIQNDVAMAYSRCDAAAAELRRMEEAYDWQYKMAGDRLRRIEKLERINAQLLEALEECLGYMDAVSSEPAVRAKVRAAIAAAKGEA